MDREIEKRVRDIAKGVYKEEMMRDQYKTSTTPNHNHDGISSQRVAERDLIRNIHYITNLIVDTSETFTLINLPFINKIMLYGFAANNADGSPATQRAVITGEANFGRSYNLVGSGTSIITLSPENPTSFINSCNYMYFDTASSNNRVGTTGEYFAYANDGTSDVVTLTIDEYKNGSITFTCTLGTNFQLNTHLVMT